jgi:transcription-repair coupling factor (superfamily II helicase)
MRGGLVDLFPMGSQLPYRIDLFDDEIESIKTFDVDTQRTVYPVPEIRLLPAREFPMDDKGARISASRFRETFEGDPAAPHLQGRLQRHRASAGIEYYLPLFFDETATVLDYLPAGRRCCCTATCRPPSPPSGRTPARATTCCRATSPAGAAAGAAVPDRRGLLHALPRLRSPGFCRAKTGGAADPAATALPDIAVDRKATTRCKLKNLPRRLRRPRAAAGRIAGRRETLADASPNTACKPEASADFAGFLATDAPLALGVGPLHGGFVLPEAGLAVITETELYAATAPHRAAATARKASHDGRLAARPVRTQGRRPGGA